MYDKIVIPSDEQFLSFAKDLKKAFYERKNHTCYVEMISGLCSWRVIVAPYLTFNDMDSEQWLDMAQEWITDNNLYPMFEADQVVNENLMPLSVYGIFEYDGSDCVIEEANFTVEMSWHYEYLANCLKKDYFKSVKIVAAILAENSLVTD